MTFWNYLSGILTVEFTSAIPEKILDAIALAKIPLEHVRQKSDLTYQLQIRRRDYKYLKKILQQREEQLIVVKKQGLYLQIRAFLHRPVLLSVLLLLLLSSLYLPTRIFFVAVEGNTTVPERLILSAAENCGIRFCASRKHIRSEKVKNELLSAVPQLQWAGINTSGCTAVISVRERKEEALQEKNIVSNLVADRDGYILSATVTGGTAHVAPGDAVTEGQLLISGYTDGGICIRAARAEGELLALTNRKITAVMPEFCRIPEETRDTQYQISILMGKKRINLWKDSRISHGVCGRMYQEYYVSLPGGFRLPVAICVDRYMAGSWREGAIPEDAALLQLQQFSERHLLNQMVAGQILQKQQQLTKSEGLYQLYGSYTCTEMIGREQREQIGVINGKGN